MKKLGEFYEIQFNLIRQNDRSPAILDEMKLELKDMQISKCEVLKKEGEGAVDDLRQDDDILNPTSFALIIKRNLSSGWYKEIPELDISGRLKSIVVSIERRNHSTVNLFGTFVDQTFFLFFLRSIFWAPTISCSCRFCLRI